jgi:hypothetical protein
MKVFIFYLEFQVVFFEKIYPINQNRLSMTVIQAVNKQKMPISVFLK